jgi:predicted RNA-binding protein YlxR (DUF448 family)
VRAKPVRMCMGCGGRAPQGELLRLTVATDGTLAVIAGRRHAGRTGYLHPRQECWERFTARKGLLRSLGRAVDRASRAALVRQLKQAERFAIVG